MTDNQQSDAVVLQFVFFFILFHEDLLSCRRTCELDANPTRCVSGRGVRRYLVEEALAELVHGALQLVPLALPLLVVAHGLGCGPLPRGGPGVVVHVVVPAPLVHSLLPAGG